MVQAKNTKYLFHQVRIYLKLLPNILYHIKISQLKKDGTWDFEGSSMSEGEGIEFLKSSSALVFQVIHGTYGEDGTLVELLEKNEIPFIGSNAEVMRVTINKLETEKLLAKNNIVVPKSAEVFSIHSIDISDFTFPLIVKPKDEGSSVSLFKVHSEKELLEVLEQSLEKHKSMLVQEFVEGREFTCGVVELDGIATPLTPTEIILTKSDVFDYDAKYTVGGCEEITPAQVSELILQKLQELAQQVHIICGCKDISRTDMIMKSDGTIVILEINTIPGMTRTSFIPAQLKASSYTLKEFVEGMLVKYE